MARLFSFTVDIEESFPGGAKGGNFFLSLFNKYGITGTFFATVEAMAMHPDLMVQILEDGHELASHSYTHYHSSDKRPKDSGVINYMTGDCLEGEIAAAFKYGERFGVEFKGYRAPSFGINEEGLKTISQYFEYDSSFLINSDNHRRCYEVISTLERERRLCEVPISRTPLLGVPFGAPYLLGMPFSFLIKTILSRLPENNPAVFYAHSFEAASLNPKGQRISPLKWFWYERNCGPAIANFYQKFISCILDNGFEFVQMKKLIEQN